MLLLSLETRFKYADVIVKNKNDYQDRFIDTITWILSLNTFWDHNEINFMSNYRVYNKNSYLFQNENKPTRDFQKVVTYVWWPVHIANHHKCTNHNRITRILIFRINHYLSENFFYETIIFYHKWFPRNNSTLLNRLHQLCQDNFQ